MTPDPTPTLRERLEELRFFAFQHENSLFALFVVTVALGLGWVLHRRGHTFHSLPPATRAILILLVVVVGLVLAVRSVGTSERMRERFGVLLFYLHMHEGWVFLSFVLLAGGVAFWVIQVHPQLPVFLVDQVPIPTSSGAPDTTRLSPPPTKAPSLAVAADAEPAVLITRLDVFSQTTLKDAPQDFTDRWVQRLLQIEADRRHIGVSDAEVTLQLQRMHGRGGDTRDREAARAEALVRKLLLHDISQEQMHHLYQVFRDDLVEYEVFALRVANRREAEELKDQLRDGASFKALAAKRAVDAQSQAASGRLGFMTVPMLRRLLGTEGGDAIPLVTSSFIGTLGPVSTPYGLLLIKVGDVRSSYERLRPALEDIVVQAGRPRLLARLMTQGASDTKSVLMTPVPVHGGSSSTVQASPSTFAIPSAEPSSSSLLTQPVPSASSEDVLGPVYHPPKL